MHESPVCLRRVAVNRDTGATVVLAERGQEWYDEGDLTVARPSRWQSADGSDVEGNRAPRPVGQRSRLDVTTSG